jgi:hypothetical protein
MSANTFNAEIEMSKVFEKQLASSITGFTSRAVEFLAEKYGFDYEEALRSLELENTTVKRGVKTGPKKEKKEKAEKVIRNTPSIPLPFCGAVCDEWCKGIRLNHSLYTQCTMEPADGEFCKTCQKQADKNEGAPTYGHIRDRVEKGADFRDPKGKPVVNYGNVMEKLNISKEAATEEAAKFGWEIPEDQFEVKKAQRGRPKKDTSASDTDSENGEVKEKKPRGRPKKEKKVISASVGDDLIANLVAKANEQSDADAQSSDEAVAEEPVAKPAKAPKKPKMTDEEKAKAKELKKAKAELAKIEAKAKAEAEAKAKAEAEAKAKAEAEAKAKAEAEAKAKAEAEEKAAEELVIDELSDDEEEEEDEEEELEVCKWEHEGKTYLKEMGDFPQTLYDPETQEEVGTWDGEKIELE